MAEARCGINKTYTDSLFTINNWMWVSQHQQFLFELELLRVISSYTQT